MAINGIELAVGQKWKTRDGTGVRVDRIHPSEGFAVVQPFCGREYSVFLNGRVWGTPSGANRAGDLVDLTWAPSCESATKDDKPFPPLDPALLRDTPMSALDTQVGGDHYKKLAIQPMEYSMANRLDPCQSSVVKYITRFRDKGGIKDLEKAKHVIDMLIEFERKAGAQ